MKSIRNKLRWWKLNISLEIMAWLDHWLERLNKWTNDKACDIQLDIDLFEYDYGE